MKMNVLLNFLLIWKILSFKTKKQKLRFFFPKKLCLYPKQPKYSIVYGKSFRMGNR